MPVEVIRFQLGNCPSVICLCGGVGGLGTCFTAAEHGMPAFLVHATTIYFAMYFAPGVTKTVGEDKDAGHIGLGTMPNGPVFRLGMPN